MNNTAAFTWEDLDRIFQILKVIWGYVPPVILVVATIGNALTVFTMTLKNTRRLNIALPLICLAFSDTLCLYTSLLSNWLYTRYGMDIKATPAGCIIWLWISCTAENVSTWIIILVTLERFMSIYSPITARSRPRKFTAPLRLAGLLMFFMIFNGHYFYTYRFGYDARNRPACLHRMDSMYVTFLLLYWPWIDLCASCFFPFTILMFCNVGIVYKLKTGMKTLTEGQGNGNGRRRKAQKSVNVGMILLLNGTFIVCTLPNHIFILVVNYYGVQNTLETFKFWLIRTVIFMMMYTNNAINFFLYLIAGRQFRNEFLRMIGCREADNRGQKSLSAVSVISK